MVERAVVAFRIVLDRDLPVAVLGDLDPFQRLEAGDVRHKIRQFARALAETTRPSAAHPVEIGEDEAMEVLDAHRLRQISARFEALNGFDVGAGAQLARQLVAPGVIGADQQPGIAFARDQLMGAVLADIVETAQYAIAAANAEQVLAGDSSKVK
jgi:hypothetical protein